MSCVSAPAPVIFPNLHSGAIEQGCAERDGGTSSPPNARGNRMTNTQEAIRTAVSFNELRTRCLSGEAYRVYALTGSKYRIDSSISLTEGLAGTAQVHR